MEFSSLTHLLESYENDQVVIEDVIVRSSLDGTSYDLTFCGPYGLELYQEEVCDHDFRLLKSNTLFNYIFEQD